MMNRFIAKATSEFTYAIVDDKAYEDMYLKLLEANSITMANNIIPVLDVYESYTCGDLIDRIENLASSYNKVFKEGYELAIKNYG